MEEYMPVAQETSTLDAPQRAEAEQPIYRVRFQMTEAVLRDFYYPFQKRLIPIWISLTVIMLCGVFVLATNDNRMMGFAFLLIGFAMAAVQLVNLVRTPKKLMQQIKVMHAGTVPETLAEFFSDRLELHDDGDKTVSYESIRKTTKVRGLFTVELVKNYFLMLPINAFELGSADTFLAFMQQKCGSAKKSGAKKSR